MRLIFVYNANSGRVNALWDGIHKIIRPESYNCNLCALTFGAFNEKKAWKQFRESSRVEMQFLHKDEFETQFASKWLPKYDYPVILEANDENLELFISSEEMQDLSTSEELIKLIESRLSQN